MVVLWVMREIRLTIYEKEQTSQRDFFLFCGDIIDDAKMSWWKVLHGRAVKLDSPTVVSCIDVRLVRPKSKDCCATLT